MLPIHKPQLTLSYHTHIAQYRTIPYHIASRCTRILYSLHAPASTLKHRISLFVLLFYYFFPSISLSFLVYFFLFFPLLYGYGTFTHTVTNIALHVQCIASHLFAWGCFGLLRCFPLLDCIRNCFGGAIQIAVRNLSADGCRTLRPTRLIAH